MKRETNPSMTYSLIWPVSNEKWYATYVFWLCDNCNHPNVNYHVSKNLDYHGVMFPWVTLGPCFVICPISAASPDSEGEKIIREIVLTTTPVIFSVCRPVFWNFNWLQTMSRNRPLTWADTRTPGGTLTTPVTLTSNWAVYRLLCSWRCLFESIINLSSFWKCITN